jgi:toxin ParE1/3/4
MAERRWSVRLGAAAELDSANIVKWTTENFGARQSRVDQNTLVQAIGELAEGPDIAGSKARDEIMSGLRMVHVARHGRRGSHFVMYWVAPETTIEIVRILHTEWTFSVTFHLPPTRMPNRAAVPVGYSHPGAILDKLACSGVSGAPRPMKMGTIASPWRYDIVA